MIRASLTIGMAIAAAIGTASSASAAVSHHKRHHPHPVRPVLHPRPWVVTRQTVLGHQVTSVSYRPGRGGVRLQAIYGSHRKTPLAWGTVTHALAVMNADTWEWKTNVPNGPARVQGQWITQPPHVWSPEWGRPAVGFYSTGGIVFGAQAAEATGAANIVSGPAYLIRDDQIQTTFPWAHSIQITCGPGRTDGAGCWRSNIVRYDDGRVGMVEVAFASMPTTARVLQRLHVKDALTFDSGGSSVLGWRPTTTSPWSRAGIQQAIGSSWLRPVPEAVALVG